jgi:hypothetical protein
MGAKGPRLNGAVYLLAQAEISKAQQGQHQPQEKQQQEQQQQGQ